MSDRRTRGPERGAIGAAAVALTALALAALARWPAGETHGSERAGGATDDGKKEREQPAVREGVVAAIMAGFVVFVVATTVGLFFFFRALAPNATFVTVHEFPAPRLQTRADGLRDPEIASQQADLGRFRWIDRHHGVFQIPIERAMRLVAARGAKAWDPVSPQSEASFRPQQGAAR